MIQEAPKIISSKKTQPLPTDAEQQEANEAVSRQAFGSKLGEGKNPTIRKLKPEHVLDSGNVYSRQAKSIPPATSDANTAINR